MADIFDVIADGTRREILQLLLARTSGGEHGGTSVSRIVADLGVSQPTVSKHLKVLREAGLVSVREEGQHRYYSLSTAPLDIVDDWLMPFMLEQEQEELPALPGSAAQAAEAVGRAAASAKHALSSVFSRMPGR
ncbi:helix-turn-helix transcriptional regulator [Microbacterium sp. zg.Y1084]|uniref:ArsR/SmtB family transcription factor n=1 Tax=Microbacterium sp. zg.Y1084 TaxID=2969667 RepID=UPI00214B9976|nr:metalloregulator ArsR/SmtB family transcription factor [Microbacterium sp. zg.Y1084]MCR2812510.1 metalloregulator ArsR/SmtB family transcription factor [Microbacterium sp. zg.Y1084]